MFIYGLDNPDTTMNEMRSMGDRLGFPGAHIKSTF